MYLPLSPCVPQTAQPATSTVASEVQHVPLILVGCRNELLSFEDRLSSTRVPCRETEAALALWSDLRSNASTPSTFLEPGFLRATDVHGSESSVQVPVDSSAGAAAALPDSSGVRVLDAAGRQGYMGDTDMPLPGVSTSPA